jgi:hypothetical protein
MTNKNNVQKMVKIINSKKISNQQKNKMLIQFQKSTLHLSFFLPEHSKREFNY